MSIVWSPLAIERLTEAAAFIARDDRAAAERWALQVFERVERLAAFPESGRIVPELGRQDIRELIYGAYRIIYRCSADSILILTVRHGRRRFEPDEMEG
jgi:plasmid stabilization system protein ParE